MERKLNLRLVDLAVAAGRRRQSPRTGFIHLFSADPSASDTIPIYENFCFALSLFRQKTAESVLEGKIFVERLLAFQNAEGNFPVYLHDFPRAWDGLMALRIAPILMQIERHFGAILGSETRDLLRTAQERALRFAAAREKAPMWEERLQALKLAKAPFFEPKTAEEWFEWIVSAEAAGVPIESQKVPYHPEFQVVMGEGESQEKGEPSPNPVEWLLAEPNGFSERLLRDHPGVLRSATVFPIAQGHPPCFDPYALIEDAEGVRMLWGKHKLHSFSAPGFTLLSREENLLKMCMALSDPVEIGRNDLLEAALFCDIAPDTEVTIEGAKGTVFRLGDRVQIRTSTLSIELILTLQEGSGDFCGQVSRANRPAEKGCTGTLLYEVFDWQISLRTLRRSEVCKITLRIFVKDHEPIAKLSAAAKSPF